jgi:hypothetical protein
MRCLPPSVRVGFGSTHVVCVSFVSRRLQRGAALRLAESFGIPVTVDADRRARHRPSSRCGGPPLFSRSPEAVSSSVIRWIRELSARRRRPARPGPPLPIRSAARIPGRAPTPSRFHDAPARKPSRPLRASRNARPSPVNELTKKRGRPGEPRTRSCPGTRAVDRRERSSGPTRTSARRASTRAAVREATAAIVGRQTPSALTPAASN